MINKKDQCTSTLIFSFERKTRLELATLTLARLYMNRSIEAIPTWALCYIINGDTSGLTDEEIRMVDEAKLFLEGKRQVMFTILAHQARLL